MMTAHLGTVLHNCPMVTRDLLSHRMVRVIHPWMVQPLLSSTACDSMLFLSGTPSPLSSLGVGHHSLSSLVGTRSTPSSLGDGHHPHPRHLVMHTLHVMAHPLLCHSVVMDIHHFSKHLLMNVYLNLCIKGQTSQCVDLTVALCSVLQPVSCLTRPFPS